MLDLLLDKYNEKRYHHKTYNNPTGKLHTSTMN